MTCSSTLSSSRLRASKHLFADLVLQVGLKLVESSIHFVFIAGALNDLQNAPLNIDAPLDHPKHFVAGSEHSLKQHELLAREAGYPLLGAVLEIEKVDDGHVDLLSVAVTAPDALLNALRIPRQVKLMSSEQN